MTDADRPPITNPPGRDRIRYRPAAYGPTLEALRRAIGDDENPGLGPLSTRDPADWTMAFFDAVASMGHLLSFYSERAANESYLATATERLSLRHLARLVDHELAPGKAADAHLQFQMDDRDDVPPEVVLPIGILVDSVPGPGEELQHFETVEERRVRRSWAELPTRSHRPVDVAEVADAGSAVVVGGGLRIGVGDVLLFRTPGAATVDRLRVVTRSAPGPEPSTTLIEYREPGVVNTPVQGSYRLALNGVLASVTPIRIESPAAVTSSWVSSTVDAAAYRLVDLARPLRHAALAADLVAHLTARVLPATADQVLVFRDRAALFGLKGPVEAPANSGITTRPSTTTIADVADVAGGTRVWLPLDNTYNTIGPGSLIAVTESASSPLVFEVIQTDQAAKAMWGYGATVTRVLVDAGGDRAALLGRDLPSTTVHIVSEPLALAPEPIDEPVEGAVIDLDRLDLDLEVGQAVAISGVAADLDGVRHVEVRTVVELYAVDGRTVVVLDAALARSLMRATVRLNANVVRATHGRTVDRVLGSGAAAAPFQTFRLPDAPLTFVGAATPSGVRSTLEVRVDGVRWHQVRRLAEAGPDDRVYELRHHEDGTTSVRFGDGITGARLPTGVENVTGRYRVGAGTAGLVRAGQLMLLAQRPAGIAGVTNPLAAIDASDGETIDQARAAASASIMTLGRVVSLRDHEDFARTFSGIAKASATWVWDGRRQAVVVTVAGDRGAVFPTGSDKLRALEDALVAAGDGATPISVRSYRPVPFVVSASVSVDPDHVAADVLAGIDAALRARFEFASRPLGGWIARSEVIATMQGVTGVVYVDLDTFDRADTVPAGLRSMLTAEHPGTGERTSLGAVEGAELLMLADGPLEIGLVS